MLRNKKITKGLSLLITMVMVLGYMTSFVYAEDNQLSSARVDLIQEAAEKIEIELQKDLEEKDLVEIMVYMKDQVDTEMVAQATRKATSYLTPYNTKLQVRRGVVEALKDKSEMTQSNILKYLEQEMEMGNVEEYTSYHLVNMVYVKATKEVVENISYMREVEKIYKNKVHMMETPIIAEDVEPAAEGVEWNITRVGADQAWDLGYDGTGAVVANIDSGVDWTHPALKNHWRGYNSNTDETNPAGNWFDPVYNTQLPADSDSHGTHVMGTMIGQEPDGSNPVGVAPGAKWIAARVFNTAGSTTDAILLSAAQWIVAPGGDPDAAPDVVNNSWGGGAGIDDWYRDAVRNWRAAEIFPVFSAGNQRTGEPAPWPGSISVPANYPESFAVAAVDRYDAIASFSKLGPSPYDESLIKPEISGPGVSIKSSIPGGYTSGYSGTSMSAPHISGTVALLRSANSALTVDEIGQIIKDTADPLTNSTYPSSPNMGFGYGMVNAFEAVSQVAAGTGYMAGRVLQDGEDLEDLVIRHDQEIFETYAGSDIEIAAEITDDVAVLEAELLVKQEGKSYWMLVPMNKVSGDHKDGIYKGTITYDMLLGDSLVYKIRARDYAGEVVVSQDYRVDISFGVIPGEYTQGFESNVNGWTMDGVWEWGLPSGTSPAPYEGEQVAGTILNGNYTASADSWMIAPPIDLRDNTLEAASLRYYQWYDIENNYDKAYVLVTDDYGTTWTQVALYTGPGTTWTEQTVNLDEYIGSINPVFVAFRFTSDGSMHKTGWYIDNVRLFERDNEAPAVPTNFKAEASLLGIKLSWTHSPDADISHYNIYRSEVAGGEYELLEEASLNSYIDSDVVVGTTYYYVISAQDTSRNVSDYTVEVSATPMEAETLFSTDFENDNGGFTTGVTAGTPNPWEWGVPVTGPNAAFSGEKLWATDLDANYAHYTDAYIETPTIVIPEDKLGILSFNHWVEMEGTTTLYDYGQVQISKDDGATWTNITPAAGGKYGRRVQTWANEEIYLNGYVGETIKLRFFFHSDVSGAYPGWYIDDVNVMAIDYVAPEPVEGEVIIYDDGTAEDALVLNGAGNGLAVRFTPSAYGIVEGVNIYLWDNSWPTPGGNRLGFVIYDENGTQIGTPLYVDNLVRGGWNTIDLSEFNFSTASDFYISTMQDAIGDNTPGTGLDDNVSSDRSKSYLNIGGELTPLADEGPDYAYAIMIRAIVNYEDAEETVDNIMVNRGISIKKPMVKNNNSLRLLSDEAEVKKADYVDPIAPNFNLKKVEVNNYETVSDIEVANTPMARGGGIPITDAVVTVLETGRSVKTDPISGKYSMRAPMGTYTLRAEAYGFYSAEAEVTVEEDLTVNNTFILEPKPQGTIIGSVFDRYYDDAAAYAVIRVVEDSKIPAVTADAEGNFTIPNVYEGVYTLKVIADGFDPGEVTVEVVGNEITNVDIPLKRFVGFEDEIIYDDGTGENALVLNSAGYGLAVRFTPEQFGKVTGANVYFWDNSWPAPGGNRIGFAIYSTDENGLPSKVGEPIFQDIVRGEWNRIDLSSFGFSTDRDFYISTIQDAAGTSCPGTGIDETSPYGDRSYLNLDGVFETLADNDTEGGLMIRALVENSVSTPEITNLQKTSYTNQDAISVEGIVGADCIVNVYVNGAIAATVNSEDLRFTAEVELPLDTSTIMVTSELDGRQTEPSPVVTVIKDKVAPVLVVSEPLDNAKIKVESVHVIGNVVDDIALAKLEINEVEIVLDEEGNFDERLMLNPGENIITVKATDGAGNVTTVERIVLVELEVPVITNVQPSEDMELVAGEILTVSFNAPTGGNGYFRLVVPFGLQNNDLGIPMTEVDGLYSGTWTVPAEIEAEDIQVEVVFVSAHGHEVAAMAEGRITIVLGDDPVDPEPAGIINLQPATDVELYSEDTLEISFNAPAGGAAYYRIMLPFGPMNASPGNAMTEVTPGLYTATYRAHDGVVASNLQIEVVFEGADGSRITEIAEGKLTLIGEMENLPVSSIIIGNEAFDMDYLNTNAYAQSKLMEAYNSGQMVYFKMNGNTIVTETGSPVTIEVLPEILRYYDIQGITLYSK